MAENHENPLDLPTEQSVKAELSRLPTWEEWLQKKGFLKGRGTQRWAYGDDEWNREWKNQGRGWAVRVYPERRTIEVSVYSNPLRYGKPSFRFEASERNIPKLVGKIIREIERAVSDQSKKRRLKALELKTPKEPREDEVPLEKLVLPEAGPIRQPIPDSPDDLNPEQMAQMLDRLRVRCFQPGQRVRVRTERQTRLNGLVGTVVDAGPHSCYVAIDEYVEAGDPDPFRFEEQELEAIYPQQESLDADVDAPTPYMAALDWYTALKDIGYKLLAGSYRKSIRLSSDKGYLRIMVEPDEKIPAASIYIEYRSEAEGESERIQDIVVPAIEVVDTVREIEALVDHKDVYGITDFAKHLQAKNYKGTPIPPLGHLMYLFGESAMEPDDVDNPEPYFQELQRHYEVINAFRAHGVKMRRRMRADHPYYEMFWIPNAVTDVSYDLYLTPTGEGWTVEASGQKAFDDDRWGQFQEDFDIDHTWYITNEADLETEVDEILSALRDYQGPEEPTVPERDYDDIDENIDDVGDLRDYALGAAGWNPVRLLTSKQIRQFVREAGFKVSTIYRSRTDHGWSVSATPATAEAFEVFQKNPHRMAEFMEHTAREAIKKLMPHLAKIERGMYNLDDKLYVHAWEWNGSTSADPSNPNNWVVYLDIRPADYQKYRRGGVKEAVDPDEVGDIAAYAKSTSNVVAAFEEAGYTYGHDRTGRERWNKYWPLPQPLRHEKPWSPIWTKFWGSPDPFGQYVYGITSDDFVNATAGGYIVVRPVKAPANPEGWDYMTSVRRVLLKVENMVREMPKDTTDIDVMRNYVFTAMERIKNEVNAEADTTNVEEAVVDPDDPQAFIDRARAAKMGDTVEVKCPRCGEVKLLGKNWPDNFKGWGTTCGQCGTFLPLGGEVVVDSVQDPDDPNAVLATHQPRVYALYGQYADYDAPVSFSTFTTLDQAVERAKERELHAEYEHVWADELEAKDLSRWDTGETMVLRYTGVKFLITPDYEVKRVEQPVDPQGYTRPPNAMHESEDFQDIDDPGEYAKTTFDPVAFLQSAGWKKLKTEAWEYWHKDFPLPQPYHLGGMKFTQLRITLGFDPRFFGGAFAASVNIYWIDDEGHGLPVKGWNLEPQLVYPQLPDAEDISVKDLDYEMPIRRFVTGIGDVIAHLKYPASETAVLVLNTHLEAEMGRFVRELNQRADRPLNPMRESVDPDAPEPYVQSLGTIDHVMALHGMSKIYRDENEGGWLRHFKLPRPAITHINDKPDDPLVALSGKVNELRLVVVYKKVPDPVNPAATLHDVRLFVRVPDGESNRILWGTSEVFKSEHDAARSLSEAVNYAILSLENNHPTDVTELTQLRQILQMGVGPFLSREE